MQSSSTFIKISGPIPEVKKSALISDWDNIVAYWEEARCGLFQVQLCSLGVGVNPGRFCKF